MARGTSDAVSLRSRLLAVTFLCGVSTMAIEMSASRLLAPSFGTSLAVWTNIIGVMMAALSAGYWLGGRLADRYPSYRFLSCLVMVAGVIAALIPVLSAMLLKVTESSVSMDEFGGSFLATAVIFAPSVFILGMVNPFAIRLGSDNVETTGSLSGKVYACSTLGSLIGTLLPVLATIPLLGTRWTMYLFALLLFVVSLPGIRSGECRQRSSA